MNNRFIKLNKPPTFGLMKVALKALFTLTLLLGLNYTTHAQQTPLQLANQELRTLFQYVNNPNPNINFFYDLSGHVVDSQYFGHYNLDTSNNSVWYSLYEEMWWMAYDTNAYQKANTILAQADPILSHDTIPIAIIDWDYNLLNDTALTTGTYFDFDTVNNVLYDIPGAPNPYGIHTTFAGAPLTHTSPFKNTVFAIRPQFLFKDIGKDYNNLTGGNTTVFKIDFGDGTGWHVFDDISNQNYVANYASIGRKIIQFGIFINGTLSRLSIADLIITGNNINIPPDDVIDLPGIIANVYEPPGCTPNADKKYVIYLEGFDALNNRSASAVYSQMIITDSILQLKNFGYTFVVVDWKNGNAPLQQNAMALVGLIEHLKCTSGNNGNDDLPPPPFVMIGESMGGLIARYSLCYMEQPSYQPTCQKPGVAHNTRLLMTFDSPHQGANIPLALQYFYRYGTIGTLSAIGFSPAAIYDFNKALTALDGAATQMLKYHISTDPFLATPISMAQIFEHPNKTIFDDELSDLGNYPQYCKLVALSNGSWTGGRQVHPYDGLPRNVHDTLLYVGAETQIRVLKLKLVGTRFTFEMRTNPNGTGRVFQSGIGVTHWKLKLKWFGIKPVWWTTYAFQVDKHVKGVEPYCVMPGSDSETDMGVGGQFPNFNSFNLLDVFGFEFNNNGNGHLHVSGYLGTPLTGQLYTTLDAISNGTSFGFLPTYSSFDYDRQTAALDDPILFNPVPIANIMSRTPFHTVITNPTEENNGHLDVHNPALDLCASCIPLFPNADSLRSRLINREIGDDTLWLENFNANYWSTIESERDIFVNHRNIYYNYDGTQSNSQLFSTLNFPNWFNNVTGAIVLSKQDPMMFTTNGDLRSNDNLFVNPAQPPFGSYGWTPGSMVNCCSLFAQRPSVVEAASIVYNQEHKGYMQLYPNPSEGRLTIKYQLTANTSATITVYNSMGQLVKTWEPGFAKKEQHCYYNVPEGELQLAPGFYHVVLQGGAEKHQANLIIK